MNKQNPEEPKIITCIYHKNKNGYGGVAIDTQNQIQIQIPESHELFALDNDVIEVSYIKNRQDKYFGVIKKIITHNTKNLIGAIVPYKQKFILKISDTKFGNYVVYVSPPYKKFNLTNKNELFDGIIELYPTPHTPYFTVKLKNSIGETGDATTFINQCICGEKIPYEFSDVVIKHAKKIAKTISKTEIKERTDLRHLPFVTIDGEDAKDFDDAVYCELHNNKYTLYVAIADVAHYVKHGDALDNDAYQRGTSIYLPNLVIPMLPENLSNDLCSLKPKEDRLTLCVKIELTSNGKPTKYEFFNAIINSKERLTYNQVQKWIDGDGKIPNTIKDNIDNLNGLFNLLFANRQKRGAIDFDTEEPYFEIKDNEIVKIHHKTRLNAHRLIEECMLLANVCAADFIINNKHPALFRTHEKPTEIKFDLLKTYLQSIAVKFNIKYENLTTKNYLKLLQSTVDHPQYKSIQQSILKSMQLAMYSPNNIGHFGLSYAHYAHFTSPIRRYPDLLVHRTIKSIIKNKEYIYTDSLDKIAEHVSFVERRAEELERKVDSFYKCKYATKYIGDVFHGYVTSVTNFGVFVYLPDLSIDGLIHVTELGNDYFNFNSSQQMLVGKKTGIKYNIGQEQQVIIESVDLSKLFINLVLQK